MTRSTLQIFSIALGLVVMLAMVKAAAARNWHWLHLYPWPGYRIRCFWQAARMEMMAPRTQQVGW